MKHYLTYIVIFVIVLSICGCEKNGSFDCNGNAKNYDSCISEVRMKHLIEDVLKNEEIITLVDNDTLIKGRFNFIRTDNLIRSGEIFYGAVKSSTFSSKNDSIRVISISSDTVINNDASVIILKYEKFNADSTQIILNIEYYVHNQFMSTRSKFEYSFNKKLCKWTGNRIKFEIF
jgi:hypothetical protein